MPNEIILIPSMQAKLASTQLKSHSMRIYSLLRKLQKMGPSALKVIKIRDGYVLGEMKINNPPYRLYILVNPSMTKYYVLEWAHKGNQQKIINELVLKLGLSMQFGVKKIFI